VELAPGIPKKVAKKRPERRCESKSAIRFPWNRYLEIRAIAVKIIQIPLRMIIGIAGIGFFLAA
jgi:hypothetical protein